MLRFRTKSGDNPSELSLKGYLEVFEKVSCRGDSVEHKSDCGKVDPIAKVFSGTDLIPRHHDSSLEGIATPSFGAFRQ